MIHRKKHYRKGGTPTKRRNETILFTVLVVGLCLSVILLTSAGTLAWFSLNTQVGEDAFGMSAKVTPNLVISSSSSAIGTLKADDPGVTEVSCVVCSDKFTPATHYTKDNFGVASTLPGLYCLEDYSLVNKFTGLVETADLIPLPENDGKRYFVDYTVYVAATDTAIEDSCLSITLSDNSHDAQDTLSWQAGSVDFYLDDTDAENFMGTLNLAGLDAERNTGSFGKTELTVRLPDDVIPKNTDGYITLILRCYFDGALIFIEDGTPRAFVNSQTVSAGEVKFNILISDASAPAETPAS